MHHSRYILRKKRKRRRRLASFLLLFLGISVFFGLNFIYNTIKSSQNIFEDLDSSKVTGYTGTNIKVTEEPLTFF